MDSEVKNLMDSEVRSLMDLEDMKEQPISVMGVETWEVAIKNQDMVVVTLEVSFSLN